MHMKKFQVGKASTKETDWKLNQNEQDLGRWSYENWSLNRPGF